MRRFAGLTAVLSLIMVSAVLCACHDPKEPTIVTSSTSATTAATSASETSASTTTALTETTATTLSESTGAVLTTPSETPNTTPEIIHKANGKFNYVLKNKDWKFDGEMYYHKYSDGVIVYYDKETKAYFLIDSKGQGWYYDAELNDFIKDE